MDLPIQGSSKKLSVADAAFARDFNEPLVHQAVIAFMAGGRAGTKKQKNRSEASGGGNKPWRQKGTGRARAGTIRSPIWVGGGQTFAARNRVYRQKLNRKMYIAAMCCIFSELVRQKRLVVVEFLSLHEPKTRALVAWLNEHSLKNALIILDQPSHNLELAARNLPQVALIGMREMNPVSLINYDKVLLTVATLKLIEISLL